MNTCIQLDDDSGFPIKVEQTANLKFRVTYGMHVKSSLTYAQAAKEFGECVFHALACSGKLDNSKA